MHLSPKMVYVHEETDSKLKGHDLSSTLAGTIYVTSDLVITN